MSGWTSATGGGATAWCADGTGGLAGGLAIVHPYEISRTRGRWSAAPTFLVALFVLLLLRRSGRRVRGRLARLDVLRRRARGRHALRLNVLRGPALRLDAARGLAPRLGALLTANRLAPLHARREPLEARVPMHRERMPDVHRRHRDVPDERVRRPARIVPIRRAAVDRRVGLAFDRDLSERRLRGDVPAIGVERPVDGAARARRERDDGRAAGVAGREGGHARAVAFQVDALLACVDRPRPRAVVSQGHPQVERLDVSAAALRREVDGPERSELEVALRHGEIHRDREAERKTDECDHAERRHKPRAVATTSTAARIRPRRREATPSLRRATRRPAPRSDARGAGDEPASPRWWSRRRARCGPSRARPRTRSAR